VPRSLPADNLQAADFQVLDGHIACNQCRAKSLGVSRNHDVKDTCAPSKPLGSNTNTGMGLSGLFIPPMNGMRLRNARTAAMTDGLSSRRRAP
jgi:hypothetical protein